jgi:hypothetical protein
MKFLNLVPPKLLVYNSSYTAYKSTPKINYVYYIQNNVLNNNNIVDASHMRDNQQAVA